MIIPVAPDQLAKMTDAEVVAAYEDLGFDHETAEAYTAVLRGGSAAVAKEHLLTTAAARSLATQVEHGELLEEVRKSEKAGIGFLTLAEEDDGIRVSTPKGATIGFLVEEEAVVKAASEPTVRVELARVVTNPDTTQTRAIIKAVGDVVARHGDLHGIFSEEGTFHAPGLAALRTDLIDTLRKAGVPARATSDAVVGEMHTLAEPVPAILTTLTAAVNSYRYDFTLRKSGQFAKSVEEKRFTLAPMYVPGQYDAHGDWAEPEDLQQAVWRFSRGDRMIALQHQPEAGPMGEAVEMMVMPWEHTVPMFKADGSSENVTFPAGTPWLGVIWNEDVWPLVKEGKVRGYSIGGRASLLNVELPEASAE